MMANFHFCWKTNSQERGLKKKFQGIGEEEEEEEEQRKREGEEEQLAIVRMRVSAVDSCEKQETTTH